MKKILLVNILSVLLLTSLVSNAYAAPNVYTQQNCQNNVCTSFTAGPAYSIGVNPNTNISVNFAVYTQSNQAVPQCTSGKNLYHSIQHDIGGDPNNYEYISNGSGSTIDYNFNSLNEGNQNRYYGIFYCWTQQVTDKSSLQLLLGNLNTQGQVWQTPELNLPTRSIGSATFSVPSQAKLGDTINAAFTSMPSGSWGVKLTVNGNIGKPISCGNATCAIQLTSDNGFKVGANTFTILSAIDKNGNPFSFPVESQTITLSDPNSSAQTNNSNNTTNPDNSLSETLYNPLPESDLVHTFLIIVQWLLGILGVFAVVFIIVGGFQMVIAAGNEEAIGKAKRTITWAVIGLIVALLSFSIIAIVQDLLQADVQAPTQTSQSITINKI